MLMFRFWGSDIRGSQKSVAVCQPMTDCIKPQTPVVPLAPLAAAPSSPSASSSKRRRSSIESLAPSSSSPVAKRLKVERHGDDVARAPAAPAAADGPMNGQACSTNASANPASAKPKARRAAAIDMNVVREVVNNEIGLEILLKHNELRLIEQELAKCQVALEQLRRCHLIPYPVNCPTPEQVLDIMTGKGPALQAQPGAPVPQWAPPFGVVDGPYARHYAKWLIPDPSFDGIQVDFHVEARQKGVEGRTTRNSYLEGVLPGKRPMRGFSGQKLQSLSSGYPVKSDKAGPCTLVRQLDGVRVKLVCLDCNRENFSSTQGFINHCRIAHKRDYKSHEEAARKCGQPIGPEVGAQTPAEEKPMAAPTATAPSAMAPVPPAPAAATAPGQVHPFARANLTEQEAYVSLQARIAECVKLFEDGLHPYSKKIPTSGSPSPVRSESGFVPSSQTPYLSEFLGRRSVAKNLEEAVEDAKKVEIDDSMSEDSEDGGDFVTPAPTRATGAMRVPARPQSPASDLTASARPASSKGRAHLPFGTTHPFPCPPPVSSAPRDTLMRDVDELEGDLSPNTISSNNAPSLVSDDGEYEDSEMPSDSEAGDSIAGNSVSDVAEINLEEDSEGRSGRHHRSSSGTGPETVRLRRDDEKHVAFVSPIKGSAKPIKNSSYGRVRKSKISDA